MAAVGEGCTTVEENTVNCCTAQSVKAKILTIRVVHALWLDGDTATVQLKSIHGWADKKNHKSQFKTKLEFNRQSRKHTYSIHVPADTRQPQTVASRIELTGRLRWDRRTSAFDQALVRHGSAAVQKDAINRWAAESIQTESRTIGVVQALGFDLHVRKATIQRPAKQTLEINNVSMIRDYSVSQW